MAYSQRINLGELWITFGVGKHYEYLLAQIIASDLGPETFQAVSFFHAITACDTVTAFTGRGKHSGFDKWRSYSDVTTAFCNLSTQPNIITNENVECLIHLSFSSIAAPAPCATSTAHQSSLLRTAKVMRTFHHPKLHF